MDYKTTMTSRESVDWLLTYIDLNGIEKLAPNYIINSKNGNGIAFEDWQRALGLKGIPNHRDIYQHKIYQGNGLELEKRPCIFIDKNY